MKVVELHPNLTCEDIAKGLRVVADDIEAGRYHFVPTLAVLVVGAESERKDNGGITQGYNWQVHGFGRGSYFTWKGLLASALQRPEA